MTTKTQALSGYTPNVVTGVWVGNDDNTDNFKSVQGGTVPALIWRDIMKVATEPYKTRISIIRKLNLNLINPAEKLNVKNQKLRKKMLKVKNQQKN